MKLDNFITVMLTTFSPLGPSGFFKCFSLNFGAYRELLPNPLRNLQG